MRPAPCPRPYCSALRPATEPPLVMHGCANALDPSAVPCGDVANRCDVEIGDGDAFSKHFAVLPPPPPPFPFHARVRTRRHITGSFVKSESQYADRDWFRSPPFRFGISGFARLAPVVTSRRLHWPPLGYYHIQIAMANRCDSGSLLAKHIPRWDCWHHHHHHQHPRHRAASGDSERPLRIDFHTHILPRDLPNYKEIFGYGDGWVMFDHDQTKVGRS